MYFENQNYGANLQAYALRKIIASLGYEAEVISYYNATRLHRVLAKIKRNFEIETSISPDIKFRKATVRRFTYSIPHSKLFYSNTIKQANNDYDVFITGSDQVWNPDSINQYMSLDFADKSKLTIAYAASIGKIHLNNEQQRKLKSALENTKHISIREKESIPAMQELTTQKIEYVLDPTMLLSREDWDTICSERRVKEDYMFCYFLGNNENLRKTAAEYSTKSGLKIVSLPFLNGCYRSVDDGFGEYQLYDVSPKDFLSLIKYASFVMTDSFHATVFSHLYEREFVVSGKENDEMNCRMQSLTELLGTEERYISDHNQVSVEKLLTLEQVGLNIKWDCYEKMRQSSMQFLTEALQDDK